MRAIKSIKEYTLSLNNLHKSKIFKISYFLTFKRFSKFLVLIVDFDFSRNVSEFINPISVGGGIGCPPVVFL